MNSMQQQSQTQVTPKIGSAHWKDGKDGKEEKPVTQKETEETPSHKFTVVPPPKPGEVIRFVGKPGMIELEPPRCGHTWCYWDECLKQ